MPGLSANCPTEVTVSLTSVFLRGHVLSPSDCVHWLLSLLHLASVSSYCHLFLRKLHQVDKPSGGAGSGSQLELLGFILIYKLTHPIGGGLSKLQSTDPVVLILAQLVAVSLNIYKSDRRCWTSGDEKLPSFPNPRLSPWRFRRIELSFSSNKCPPLLPC